MSLLIIKKLTFGLFLISKKDWTVNLSLKVVMKLVTCVFFFFLQLISDKADVRYRAFSVRGSDRYSFYSLCCLRILTLGISSYVCMVCLHF